MESKGDVAGPALTVRGAYKAFPSQVILQGLDMTVPQGCIYTLLGPSGCGKTTLFKCIVGREFLDSGEIFVRAKHKNNIGYMPQELCLYYDFSIRETFVYYGMLYNMTSKDIARRTQELVQLCSLPSPDHTINELSGGQQRRVSFSVALLHNPEFLILDEPTVGLDPVICHEIWKYLHNLTNNEKKSILITTHYIEEARQSNVIALMREGVILAEQSPLALMDTHQCDSLEQVFLHLSQNQATTQPTQDNHVVSHFSVLQKKGKSPLDESNKISYNRIKAQNKKSVYWMSRNIIPMLFVFNLSMLETVIFNLAIGKSPEGLHLGFVNEEMSNGIDTCDSVPLQGCNLESLLSCRFLNMLENKSLVLTEFSTYEEGISAVKSNDVWGLMHFSSNYTGSFLQRISTTLGTSEEVVGLSEVNIWLDMSDQIIGNLLKRDLYSTFTKFLMSLFEDCGWPKGAGKVPIDFKEAIYGSNVPNLTLYSSPSLIALAQFFMPVMCTIAALLSEKSEGLVDRNMVAGLNIIELLFSHFYVNVILLVIHTAIIVSVNYVLFDNIMQGSWLLYLSLMMGIGICGLCCGTLLSAMCSTDSEASVLGTGLFLVMTFTSGILWPTEGMHPLIRPLCLLLPLNQPIEAYRAIAFRGWSLTHPTVYLGFLACGTWVVAFLLIAAAFYNWTNFSGNKK